MNIIKKAGLLENFLLQQKDKKIEIGFVPTMGALHAGHHSLLQESLRRDDLTVCSIFVNPTQFNDPDDYEKYPSTPLEDIQLLESAGCQVLFLPALPEIYPEGLSQLRQYELGFLETVLEGKFRPGHFQGVCQVVHRLLNIVMPDRLYLGQKDFQQCLVIRKLLSLVHLENKISLQIMPTIRETDGLAMSSRNKRLSPQARAVAPEIYRTLCYIKQNIQSGNTRELIQQGMTKLEKAGFKIDYLQLASADTLHPIEVWNGEENLVVLTAVFLEGIRLIDNLIVR